MRQPHIKPPSRPVGLYNYLPHNFTFYWDKEPYTIKAGATMTMFEWLAIHGAVKMAEEWFNLHLNNPNSSDPKVKGFYTRHDDSFKNKVKEAIIYPEKEDKEDVSELSSALTMMNMDDEEKEEFDDEKKSRRGRPRKEVIELPEVDDEIVEGCEECRATGPRHKPTCSKFVKHEKDAAQEREFNKKIA